MKFARTHLTVKPPVLLLRLTAKSRRAACTETSVFVVFVFSGGDGNFVLSTSCVGFSKIIGGCSAMVKDGYGAFYSIEDNK